MRRDLSWRHATGADLGRFTYINTLGRWTQNTGLSRRASRVLGFYAALNRCGTFGYRGTRCSQAELSAAIGRATGEAASVPTIQRAFGELRVKGFLDVGTAFGKARRTAPDVVQREPIRVYSLTEKAIALWSGVPRMTTNINLGSFGSSEQKFETNFMPTRAHERSVSSVSKDTLQNEVINMTSQDSKLAERESNEHAEMEKEQKSGRSSRFSGVSNSSVRGSRVQMLGMLTRIVQTRGRAGKRIIAKAALLLSDPKARCGADLHYWAVRWEALTHDERTHAMREEIIPCIDEWSPREPGAEPVRRTAIAPEPPSRYVVEPDLELSVNGLKAAGFDEDLLKRLVARCG